MRPLQTDLSIYKKFNFEKPPVGINYSFHRPEGIEKLDNQLGLCEMVKEAQERKTPFYFSKEEENCVGKMFLGMTGDTPRRSDGGQRQSGSRRRGAGGWKSVWHRPNGDERHRERHRQGRDYWPGL